MTHIEEEYYRQLGVIGKLERDLEKAIWLSRTAIAMLVKGKRISTDQLDALIAEFDYLTLDLDKVQEILEMTDKYSVSSQKH